VATDLCLSFKSTRSIKRDRYCSDIYGRFPEVSVQPIFFALLEARIEKVTFVDTFVNPLYISIPKKSKAAKFYKEVAQLMWEYRSSGKINQYFEKYGLPVPI
jgi:hypothetical protein